MKKSYNQSFFLENSVWNNTFSFEVRKNKKLFIPSFKKIKSFSEIKFWNEIVFEDFDFNGVLQSCKGLKNFYEIDWRWKKIFLFDNHNHAYYFWYLARKLKIIWDNNILFHIDEHADTRDNDKHLLKPYSEDIEKVFEFTNYTLNVWDYITPAIEEGIIWEVIQIRSERSLRKYLEKKDLNTNLESKKWGIILNLDLDFFQPDLDFIDYDLKKRVILDIAKKSDIITVATSPFFINQELAIKVFKDVFEA